MRHACEARASGVQVAAGDVKALGLAAALEDGAALAEGGLLYHDSVHGVWLYEGDAVHARLLALKQARPRHCSPVPPGCLHLASECQS